MTIVATESEAPSPAPKDTGFKQVGRHVLIYGLGIVLSRAIGFIMLPVYTSFLTPADYGVMELVQMTLDVISIAAGAQLALGMFRYYHKAEAQAEKNAVVSTALVALALSYAVVGTGTFIFAGALSQLVFDSTVHADLIRIASVSLAFQSLLVVPLAYARLRDRSVLFVAANALKLALSLGFNLLFLVHLGMGVKGIFLGNLIANLCVGGWLATVVLREVGLHFSRAATRNLVRYGVPLIGMHLASFIMTFSDRYFLQAQGDATVVGLYTLAYVFGFVLAMIGYMPFESVWEPKRFEIARQPNRDEMYARAFIYLNVSLVTAAVGIALFVGDLLRIMSTPAFHSAADIVPIILIAYVLQGWTGMQNIGILMKERTELITLAAWAGAVTALLSYWLLVPEYLGWGAAIGTVLAFAVRHILVYVFSQRVWPVAYRWAPVLRLLALAFAVAIVGELLPPMTVLHSIVTRAALFAAYLVAMWHLSVLSSGDRARIRSVALAVARFRFGAIRAGMSEG